MSLGPAYHIELTDYEFAMLGKLVAALGQIEEQMVACVAKATASDRETAERIMGQGATHTSTTVAY